MWLIHFISLNLKIMLVCNTLTHNLVAAYLYNAQTIYIQVPFGNAIHFHTW